MSETVKSWSSRGYPLTIKHFGNKVTEGYEIQIGTYPVSECSMSFYPSKEELDEIVEFLQQIRGESFK